VLPGESRQADHDLAGEGWRAVEHYQAEGVAAQEDVGTPGAAVGAGRPDHPQPAAVACLSPLARGEGARPIDDGHPAPGGDRRHHQVPDECGPPAPARALDLRQPPTRHPAVRQRAVQRLDPGGDRGGAPNARGCENRRQLLTEGEH
jgi:hypothetical protein